MNQCADWVLLYEGCVVNNMAQRPVEKHYGRRTLQERADGYLQMNIPLSVVEDEKTAFEPGQTVTVCAVISNGESFIKIEAEGGDE